MKLLRVEGLSLPWVDAARGVLLALAAGWSLWLGWRICAALPPRLRLAPMSALLVGNALIGYCWWLQFWGW
ncbi:hypothetical protein D9M69_601140 [compost metagenome]